MDKKSIFGFVLIFIFILLMPYYFLLINPQKEQIGKSVPIQQTNLEEPAELTTPLPIHKASPIPVSKTDENTYVIETKLYKAILSNQGGGTFKSYILKNYKNISGGDTTNVELVIKNENRSLLMRYISVDGDSVELNQNFTLESSNKLLKPDSKIVVDDNDSLQMTFFLKSPVGKVLARKVLTFHGGDYTINLLTDITGLKENIASRFYELAWTGGLPYTEALIKDEIQYSKAYAYTAGDAVALDVKPGKTNMSNFDGNTAWTAIRNKYFTAAFIANGTGIGYRLTGAGIPMKGKDYQKIFNMYLSLPVNGANSTQIYIGPLDYQTVKSLNVNLEDIMNFGAKLIRPISKGILWIFIWMHSFIPNYGWVLIIFSILLKVVLTPLTNKSTQSMKEMQKLAPKIMQIKEKYPNDPQKLNAETMKLYKEHGVNPMGGCLPMILQMPILWALFIIFRSTIELRQAAFIWWIKDLSAPDALFTLTFKIPLYGSQVNILPIIMVISQVFQQKMSAGSSNQQQKMMMYVMPIIFFFLFNQFPSGLNLYYTLFNIFSMIQQKYMTPEAKPKIRKQRTIDTIRQLQRKAKKK